jgi:hypothetical protein
MKPSDDRKEAREVSDKPVGERLQDLRSREEVIKERDARHLADEANYGTDALDVPGSDDDGPSSVGAERRMREGTPKAKTPDGRPYAEDDDPDSYGDKGGTLGGTGGRP